MEDPYPISAMAKISGVYSHQRNHNQHRNKPEMAMTDEMHRMTGKLSFWKYLTNS